MKIQHLTINNELYQSTVFKEFYEEAQRANRVIAEARRYLLTEEKLNAQQIDQIFRLVADGAAAGKNTDSGEVDMGSNKTALGKVTGAVGDALKGLKSKWDALKDWVSKSGPVQGFDVAFDQLQGSLLNAMGGEGGKVANAMQKYREFAVKHPVAQGVILVGLAALLGTAMGGGTLALAGVTFGIRTMDALLKGHKFSTSTYKGAKAAAIMTVASLGINGIIDNFSPDVGPGPTPAPAPSPDGPLLDPQVYGPDFPLNPDLGPVTPDVVPPSPTPDLPSVHTVVKGDTLSQIAQDNMTSVKALMQANPHITNPNALLPGTEINLPPINSTTYMGGVGTASDTAAKVASGAYSDVPSALAHQRAAMAMRENRNAWIDRDATVRSWALNESLGRSRGGVILTEAGVNEVFRRIDEGVWDSIKKGASAVGGAISNAAKKGWQSATNKITYDSLGMNWRSINPQRIKGDKLGMTADSREIEIFLRRNGVKDPLIASVFKQMGIPLTTVATKADDAEAGAADTTGAADDTATSTATAPGVATTTTAAPATTTTQTTTAQGGPAAATPSWADPKSADYVGRREVARRQAAAGTPATAKPDYSRTMPGYSSVTMKTPTGTTAPSTVAPTATATTATPAKSKPLGPSKVVANNPGAPTPAEREKFNQRVAQATGTDLSQNPNDPRNLKPGDPNTITVPKRKVAAEGSRVYGGKYIRESAANKAAREFEFYLKNLG